MRKFVLSATIVAVGTFLTLTHFLARSSPAPALNQGVDLLGQVAETDFPSFMLKQQAHLRCIEPLDMLAVPNRVPLPNIEGIEIGSTFGMRTHPILNQERMHQGIDFSAPAGTPVLATAGGIVYKALMAADSSGYGINAIIQHDDNFETRYAHLSRLVVSTGQVVEKGDTIGFSGSTGLSTNPHLHYEVLKDGVHLDPQDFFKLK
jgi:murein DD-endopeptidase MepM/ murein hydrolase activator NlpD